MALRTVITAAEYVRLRNHGPMKPEIAYILDAILNRSEHVDEKLFPYRRILFRSGKLVSDEVKHITTEEIIFQLGVAAAVGSPREMFQKLLVLWNNAGQRREPGDREYYLEQ